MKKLLILLGILLLVGTASAVTWTSASGCWTATDGSYSLVMWNATGSTTWLAPAGVASVEFRIYTVAELIVLLYGGVLAIPPNAIPV